MAELHCRPYYGEIQLVFLDDEGFRSHASTPNPCQEFLVQ